MGLWAILSLGVGAFCLLFGLIPWLIYGIFHVGVAALLILGALLVLLPLLWEKMGRSQPLCLARRFLAGIAVFSLAVGAAFSLPMA